MFKGIVPLLFCGLFAVLVTTSYFAPNYLSDSGNSFLRDFMDVDVLSVLGFVTALSNASILSIFLHLNYLDDEVEFTGTRVRRSLRHSAVSLVAVFLLSFVIVVVKPILPQHENLSALMNTFGILCVVFSLSVLRDISITVARIPSKRAIRKIQEENRANQQA